MDPVSGPMRRNIPGSISGNSTVSVTPLTSYTSNTPFYPFQRRREHGLKRICTILIACSVFSYLISFTLSKFLSLSSTSSAFTAFSIQSNSDPYSFAAISAESSPFSAVFLILVFESSHVDSIKSAWPLLSSENYASDIVDIIFCVSAPLANFEKDVKEFQWDHGSLSFIIYKDKKQRKNFYPNIYVHALRHWESSTRYPEATPLVIVPVLPFPLSTGFYSWLKCAQNISTDFTYVAAISPKIPSSYLIPSETKHSQNLPSSKEMVLIRHIDPYSFALGAKVWKSFLYFYKHTLPSDQYDTKRFQGFEHHVDGIQGIPLTARRYNISCTETFGKAWVLAERDPYMKGYPKPINRKIPASPGKHQCETEMRSVSDTELFITVFARYMYELGLYSLIPVNHQQFNRFVYPQQLLRFDWSFVEEAIDPWSRQNEKNLREIISFAREHNNSISLAVVNKPFLGLAHSFYCNVKHANYWPPGKIVLVTNDLASKRELDNLHNVKIIYFENMRGAENGADYKTARYWEFMLSRTLLVRDLLHNGVAVFLFDLDQTWLRNPWPFIFPHIKNESIDFIGTRGYSTSKTGGEIQGNFLYLKPTINTIGLWNDISNRFTDSFINCCVGPSGADFVGSIEQDQYLISKLVLYGGRKASLQMNFAELDRTLFVDGVWYKNDQNSSIKPVSIQNNWIIGIENKVDRAKEFKHWFWDEEKRECLDSIVRESCEFYHG